MTCVAVGRWDVTAVLGFLAAFVVGEGSVVVVVALSDSGRLRFFLANRSCLRRSLRVAAVVVVVSMVQYALHFWVIGGHVSPISMREQKISGYIFQTRIKFHVESILDLEAVPG
jgi:hypothetical protein